MNVEIPVLKSAYKPFPAFAEWASRTAVDMVRWERYMAELQRRAAASGKALRQAREIAKRAAALDTGALDGLYETDRALLFTVAFETGSWAAELAQKGEHIQPLFEAQARAYDLVRDLAANSEPISEAAVRDLHKIVCQAQDTYRIPGFNGCQEMPLPKGRYKSFPNDKIHSNEETKRVYAPVDVTPAEIARLVREMRTGPFRAAHPVMQAAYVHHGFTAVQPFADGNGRVARALASAFMYQSISMPIMILSESKTKYLDALDRADNGEYQAFVDFMLVRTLDTIQLVSESLASAHLPSAEESISEINSLYFTKGGYTDEQVDASGENLLQIILQELQNASSKVSSPRVQSQISLMEGIQPIQSTTHRLSHGSGRAVYVGFNTIGVRHSSVGRFYDVWVPRNAASEDDVLLKRREGEVSFAARMDELLPALSGLLQIRTGIFAERVLDEMLAELKAKAERARQKQQ